MHNPKDKRQKHKKEFFIDFYEGNIKIAAEKADISYNYARTLMTNPDFRERAMAAAAKKKCKKPKTLEERKTYWSRMMDDPNASITNRLRASELLGKAEGDFVEKKHVTLDGDVNFSNLTDDELDNKIKELEKKAKK